MNNSDTPTGGNGKNDLNRKKANMKEIEVKESDTAQELLEAFFDMTKDEMIDLHVMSYTVPKVSLKEIGGDEQEAPTGFSEIEVIDAKNTNINRNPQEFRRAWKLSSVTKNSEKATTFEKAVAKLKKAHEEKIKKENEKQKADIEKSKNGPGKDNR